MATTLNLMDLSDDCLIHICINMNVFELSDIACTCTRFRTIARRVYSLRHKSNRLRLNMFIMDKPFLFYHPHQVSASLRHFGDMVTNLEILVDETRETDENDARNTTIYNSMVGYCTPHILQKLEMRGMPYLPPGEVLDAGPLLRGLKELVLETSDVIDSALLSDAQLTSLTLLGPMDYAKYLTNDYRQLQIFTMEHFRKECDPTLVSEFLARHMHLTEIKLYRSGYNDPVVIGAMRDLTKLYIEEIQYNEIMPMAKLDKLNALQLCVAAGRQMPEFLNASMSWRTLEELELSQSIQPGDEAWFMSGIARFTHLKRLVINYGVTFDDDLLAYFHNLKELRVLSIQHSLPITSDGLVKLVRNLPHLELFVLCKFSQFDELFQKSTYLEICEIYRNREQKLLVYDYNVFDRDNLYKELMRPFASCGLQRYVEFISLLPDYDKMIEILQKILNMRLQEYNQLL